MTMREIKKLAKAAGYGSPAEAAAAGWTPDQDAAPKAAPAKTVAPTTSVDRRPGVHAGRIETGGAQYWDDDADRDARHYD